jgi:hypothetical protein
MADMGSKDVGKASPRVISFARPARRTRAPKAAPKAVPKVVPKAAPKAVTLASAAGSLDSFRPRDTA